jgi:hypothetical protein
MENMSVVLLTMVCAEIETGSQNCRKIETSWKGNPALQRRGY